ncbi:Phospholipase-like protein [Quillaja saponaria]|uniref:Phospholipase-like protein n=1 Tax=Quillaja saponaria TaxID=32244 RepID=A0AAD7VFY9_QUISA|nr:Phospholipase-like protein [Quillaja saponaria]
MAGVYEELESEEASSLDQNQPISVSTHLAPIYQAITEKHGDIAENCLFKCKCFTTTIVEGICAAVRDLQAMHFHSLQEHHLESLNLVATDAENLNLKVDWLRIRLDELTEALHLTSQQNNLQNDLTDKTKLAELMKNALDSKLAKMLNLQYDIHALESEMETIGVATKNLKSTLTDVKSKFVCFRNKTDGWFVIELLILLIYILLR